MLMLMLLRGIVFRDVDFVLSRRRRRLMRAALCSSLPCTICRPESSSLSLSLYVYVPVCVFLSHRRTDIQTDTMTCDVTCHLIASLHTSRLIHQFTVLKFKPHGNDALISHLHISSFTGLLCNTSLFTINDKARKNRKKYA